jgi:hypothetical protein
MKFVETFKKNKLRTGNVFFLNNENTFKTPGYMVYTRSGIIPYITSDLAEDIFKIYPSLLSVNIWDLVHRREIIKKFKNETKKSTRDYLNFFNPLFLTMRDAINGYDNVVCSDKTISGLTISGVKKLNLKEFIECIQEFETEIYVGIDYFLIIIIRSL